jgi:hypothetical protein
MGAARLCSGGPAADVVSMTSSASIANWLPAAIARAAVVAPTPTARPGGRHLAFEAPGALRIAAPEDFTRTGRHVEPEWSRELHDPRRDDVDAFDWLGFGPN